MDANFIGNTLTNIIIIVERIFKNLNARQLNKCSRVCKAWRDQAKREKERRPCLRWNLFLHDSNYTEENLNDKTCWLDTISFLQESPIEPKCLVIFCSNCLWHSLFKRGNYKDRKRNVKVENDAAAYLGPFLPKDCVFHVILTDGIVGTDQNMKTLELDREECDEGLSLIMFSETSDVNFIPFSLTHLECVSLVKYWSETNCQVPACMRPLRNKEVKMINLFCPMNGIDQEIGYSLFRIFDWPLIAGGYVNEKHVRVALASSASLSRGIVSGLAICGHNVKVASVLLRSQDVSEVDATIKSLTEHNFPLQKSFGLMYACVGRGVHIYGEQNIESSIFRKYFPKTPLLGFFGNGEVGCNYPPIDPLFVGDTEQQSHSNSSESNGPSELLDEGLKHQMAEMREKQEAYKLKHPPKLLHAYTTVMCLVTLP